MKYLYIILFSLVFIACGNSEKNNETVIEASINANEIIISQSQFTSENMEFGKLEEQLFNHTIKTTGMIDVPPQNKAIISAFLGGYITKTPLLIGDKVKKGQVLVTLENPEFIQIQQEYLEISEQLNYLKAEFNRQKTLFDENITSQKNFLKAESAYKSNMAHFNGLRKKLVMLNINPTSVEQGRIASTINLYSPIEGYVTKVNISNGIYVSPSDIIMEIVDTNHIHLELSVFEKDILNVKKGQKIDFKIPEASNEIFEAEVHLAGTTIDKTSRIVLVHAHLNDESKANFIVGMYVEADIITDSKKSLALPKKAIIEIDENYFILVLMKKENDTFYFEKMKVNLGVQTETFVAILNPDDFLNEKILIEGAFMLGESGD
ncbi:MAG: efflux RND transporter periplasmic adaptor subunit [Algibacter sp.]|uniref:efflux RND transporter periplasmic adaptor subunit n=1 Tax=Algibacter sp. TaxID=1872428 RepID=UPI0026314A08|nr:efflux RND transporter periplasmic adaptor subunit [Algibacter sp.]MDG1731023.1 efflux RND transporter periplasmic adaptor subunit [Algibacter sp.]MDG2179930.1 efflux RND transporter periplasmic adaptor subunit [Algibacter sp.]